jgi:hypothetical protein
VTISALAILYSVKDLTCDTNHLIIIIIIIRTVRDIKHASPDGAMGSTSDYEFGYPGLIPSADLINQKIYFCVINVKRFIYYAVARCAYLLASALVCII